MWVELDRDNGRRLRIAANANMRRRQETLAGSRGIQQGNIVHCNPRCLEDFQDFATDQRF
jgi:hypothetical protein